MLIWQVKFITKTLQDHVLSEFQTSAFQFLYFVAHVLFHLPTIIKLESFHQLGLDVPYPFLASNDKIIVDP